MKRLIPLSIVTTLSLSLYADENLQTMIDDAKINAEVRSLFSHYKNNDYTTAIGAALKYELAPFKGFSGALAFRTSRDISALSTDTKTYTELTQSYINYNYEKLNIRIGTQILDTPLADSDDIRMIQNTFRACVATYNQDKFSFILGHIVNWQGNDAGLKNTRTKTGKDGINFSAIIYNSNTINSNLWFYNISNNTLDSIKKGVDANGNNAFYIDILKTINLNDIFSLEIAVQYLKENELDHSNIQANIYGTMAKLSFKNTDITFAYNTSSKEKSKHSFSGFGGGSLYTNMDTMILDEITQDRDAQAFVTSFNYEINSFNLSYAYGRFQGDYNTNKVKVDIVEHDISIEYTPNEILLLSAKYIINNDNNIRVLASYSF